jgi:hypothetical protein
VTGLPDPLAGDGVVTFDPVSRSLLVKAKPGDRVWPLWQRGHRAWVAAVQSGRYLEAPAVYPSGARGEAVRDGWLRFTFRGDDAVFRELAGAPDLRAIVTVDRESAQILGVRFRSVRMRG